MDTTAHTIRTNPALFRTITSPPQQQNIVLAQPPRLYAIPLEATAPPLLGMPACSAHVPANAATQLHNQATRHASRPQLCVATRDGDGTAVKRTSAKTMPTASSSTSSTTRAVTSSSGQVAPVLTLENTDLSNGEKQDIFSAALVEFVGRILIEKMFFQNLHIPQDLLLSLVNNVIQTVTPKQKTKVDVYQEGIVLCKQFMGKDLTQEEQRYDKALKASRYTQVRTADFARCRSS